MDDVLARADQLANAIQESDAFLAMRRLESEAATDKTLTTLMASVQEARAAITAKEEAGTPIEPEDKRLLEERETALGANERMKELHRVQVTFLSMMDKVNARIHGALDTTDDS